MTLATDLQTIVSGGKDFGANLEGWVKANLGELGGGAVLTPDLTEVKQVLTEVAGQIQHAFGKLEQHVKAMLEAEKNAAALAERQAAAPPA